MLNCFFSLLILLAGIPAVAFAQEDSFSSPEDSSFDQEQEQINAEIDLLDAESAAGEALKASLQPERDWLLAEQAAGRTGAEWERRRNAHNLRNAEVRKRALAYNPRAAAVIARQADLDRRKAAQRVSTSRSSCGVAKYHWAWARSCSGTLQSFQGGNEGAALAACESVRQSKSTSSPQCAQTRCQVGCGSAIPAD